MDQESQVAKLTRYLDYFQALTDFGKTLTSNLKVKDVLLELMRSLSQLMRPAHWSLLLLDAEKQELYFEICVGDGADTLKDMRLPVGEGIAGWVAKHKQPLVVPNVAEDPRFCNRMDTASSFNTDSVMCVPMLCRGELLGVIELVKVRNDPQPFSTDHLHILNPFADFAAIALDNARSFQRIEELTVVDEWTSLYNARFLRTHLQDEVVRAKRYEHQLSVIFLDLDGFKAVNDTHGHSVGSSLLRDVGQLIVSCARETDRAVRYGGDEFMVVMHETTKEGALAVANRLRQTLDAARFERVLPSGRSVADLHVSASIGVATFPLDGDSAQTLIDAADRAMYAAKASGRNQVIDAQNVAKKH